MILKIKKVIISKCHGAVNFLILMPWVPDAFLFAPAGSSPLVRARNGLLNFSPVPNTTSRLSSSELMYASVSRTPFLRLRNPSLCMSRKLYHSSYFSKSYYSPNYCFPYDGNQHVHDDRGFLTARILHFSNCQTHPLHRLVEVCRMQLGSFATQDFVDDRPLAAQYSLYFSFFMFELEIPAVGSKTRNRPKTRNR